MSEQMTLIGAVVVLAAGTYALRACGPVLRERVRLPRRAEEAMTLAAVLLLAALVGTAALTEAGGFAGWARPAGVLVGGVLAWRKVPFAVVVLAAAATAALLRLAGVP
ncbi:AzlD domain-containing protein [Haloechinothrix salitolerans]